MRYTRIVSASAGKDGEAMDAKHKQRIYMPKEELDGWNRILVGGSLEDSPKPPVNDNCLMVRSVRFDDGLLGDVLICKHGFLRWAQMTVYGDDLKPVLLGASMQSLNKFCIGDYFIEVLPLENASPYEVLGSTEIAFRRRLAYLLRDWGRPGEAIVDAVALRVAEALVREVGTSWWDDTDLLGSLAQVVLEALGTRP